MRNSLLLVSLGAALSSLAVSVSARAQEHALPRYEPAPIGDRFFGVHSPYVPGHLDLHAGAVLDYAKDPFVFRTTEGGDVTTKYVDHQLLLRPGVTFALWDRLALSASMPFALSQGGDDPKYLGVAQRSPTGAALADLRVGARAALLGQHDSPLQLGVGAHVWLPTGAGDQAMSDGTVRAMPYLAIGGRPDERARFVWTVFGGPELRPSSTVLGSEQGSMLRGGAGVGYALGEQRDFQLGAEVNGWAVLREVSSKTTGLELLFSAKLRVLDDFEGGLGIGPGLVGGVGAPSFRGLLSVAYTPRLTDTRTKHEPVAATPPPPPAEPPAPVANAPASPPPAAEPPAPEEKAAPPPEPPTSAETSAVAAAKKEIEDQRVRFAVDSAALDGTAQGTIQRVAKILAANRSARVVVQGHCDETGSVEHNQELSERRAAAVTDALLRAGVSKDRLETRGFGTSQPIEHAPTPDARARNRRVDFHVE